MDLEPAERTHEDAIDEWTTFVHPMLSMVAGRSHDRPAKEQTKELQGRSGTVAPQGKQESDIGAAHFAIAIQIFGAATADAPCGEE